MTTSAQSPIATTTLSRRWFARVWSWLDDAVDAEAAIAKDEVLVDLPSQIVEIGPGRGSSFKRYPKGTAVIAYEPNRFMHDDLRAAAVEHGIELDLRTGGVEDIELDNQSQDVVVSSFTLCSVEDRSAAFRQIRRILKPGGRLLFIEHIAADAGTTMARVQRLLRRPWSALFDRCDLTADTKITIGEAGFSEVRSSIGNLGPRLDPSRRAIYGTAIR